MNEYESIGGHGEDWMHRAAARTVPHESVDNSKKITNILDAHPKSPSFLLIVKVLFLPINQPGSSNTTKSRVFQIVAHAALDSERKPVSTPNGSISRQQKLPPMHRHPVRSQRR